MGLGWYVVRTEPRAEFLAADELSRDEIEVFCPRVKTVPPRLGHEETPLFPGYIFLRCDPEVEGWHMFRPAHRILGWVNFGGEVPRMTDETVNLLRERLAVVNSQGGMWRRFRPGEKVKVVSHTLEGIAEVVNQATSPQARVNVILEFMGGLIPAQVPWQNLRPLEPEPFLQSQQQAHHAQTSKSRAPRRTRGKGRWIGQFKPAIAT